jgi:GntR family transcriptional regulator/MocR family aminotransferase
VVAPARRLYRVVTTHMRRAASIGVMPIIPFDRNSPEPFYLQIYEGVRAAITSGRLIPGQRLPSTRTLAEELQISRYPVFSAFDQLLQEGYLDGKVGSGTFVSYNIPDEVSRPIGARRPALRTPAAPVPERTPGCDSNRTSETGPLAVSDPALDRFPMEIFARLIRRHASAPPEELAYGDPAGYGPLREVIVDYLRTARAVDCDASQVLIVSGSQMGLMISALALTTPESTACVEEPGYPGAKRALRTAGATIIPVAVDNEGIDVAALARLDPPVGLVYVTPSHQYPLGMSMGLARRLELLRWAANANAWIIEDDYDSEFRYSTRPVGSLQGMDSDNRVIYLGTFSRVLFPALRLGYMVVPRQLVDPFLQVRTTLDILSPTLYQLAVNDFLRDGQFARHLRRMRAIYMARRNALLTAIQEEAADVLTVGNTDAGLHVVAFLRDGVDDRDVAIRAASLGIFPSPLSGCFMGPGKRPGLIIGFGGADEPVLRRAVRTLASLIRNLE